MAYKNTNKKRVYQKFDTPSFYSGSLMQKFFIYRFSNLRFTFETSSFYLHNFNTQYEYGYEVMSFISFMEIHFIQYIIKKTACCILLYGNKLVQLERVIVLIFDSLSTTLHTVHLNRHY
jgi:hypothetical protein